MNNQELVVLEIGQGHKGGGGNLKLVRNTQEVMEMETGQGHPGGWGGCGGGN